jgi:hypothetical protein
MRLGQDKNIVSNHVFIVGEIVVLPSQWLNRHLGVWWKKT